MNKRSASSLPNGPKRRKVLKPQIADRSVVGTFKATKARLVKGKGITTGTKKVVKVSSEFRESVKEVLKSQLNFGRLMATYAGAFTDDIGANQAKYYNMCDVLGQGYNGYLFTPNEFYSVASSLFIDNTTFPRGIGNVRPGAVKPATGGAGGNISFTIRDSTMSYVLKNNTSVTFQVDMYVCQPKTHGQCSSGTIDVTGTNVDSNSYIKNLTETWLDCTNVMKNQGLLNAEYDVRHWSNSPFEISGVSKVFDHELTRIIIGPGQTENFYVQGPKNYEYVYEKQFKNTQFLNLSKVSKSVFARVSMEALTSNANNRVNGIPGYIVSNEPANREPTLTITSELKYKITMPDTTLGYIYPPSVFGNYEFASSRRSGVLRKYQFFDANVGSIGVTTLAENPVTDKIQN